MKCNRDELIRAGIRECFRNGASKYANRRCYGYELKLRNRKQFNAMIRKCKSGKIDLILTKPISRFGRNTLDELRTLQDLRVLRVDVYFEQEKLRCYAIYIETDTESSEYRLKVIGTISKNRIVTL